MILLHKTCFRPKIIVDEICIIIRVLPCKKKEHVFFNTWCLIRNLSFNHFEKFNTKDCFKEELLFLQIFAKSLNYNNI